MFKVISVVIFACVSVQFEIKTRDVKSREFFFSIREIFSQDSTRILDHVMMMSHPAE